MAFVLGVRLAVGGLFLLAGTAKIWDGTARRKSWLRAYMLLPEQLVAPVSIIFPMSELAIGAAFALGAFGVLGYVAPLLLLSSLTAATIVTLARRLRPACGCFGASHVGVISWAVVVRNLVLICGICAAYATSRGYLAITRWHIGIQLIMWVAVMALALLLSHLAWSGAGGSSVSRPRVGARLTGG